AVDVCALNDMAVVADSDAGVAVFNVFAGMNPTLIARVDTPGNARAVACAGSLIAVADGPAGLAVVDISDPPAARLARQGDVGGPAQAVAVVAGIAYVGTSNGRLLAVDLGSGAVLKVLSQLGTVHDIAVAGDSLFVALDGELRSFSLGTLLSQQGTAPSAFGV